MMIFHKKFSKSSDFHYLETGLYTSITDNVDAMNILNQEKHNHSQSCITFRVPRRRQKVEIYLANEKHGLVFFSTDLGQFFGSNVCNEFGVMLRGGGHHNPEFAHDIRRMHSLIVDADLIEYKSVGNTKAPLLRCFPVI